MDGTSRTFSGTPNGSGRRPAAPFCFPCRRGNFSRCAVACEDSFAMRDYRAVTRDAWAFLVENGCDSTQPYGPNEFADARSWLDSRGWIPWKRVRTVLCLACGGGQQAPLFASTGCDVTLLDLSPEQLRIDQEAAQQHQFPIHCIE